MHKITSEHLARKAYVYVRQSTLSQVQNNLESQRRQYKLAERAKELGWREVITIDEDLGCSGSGTAQRNGFERLMTDVCSESVGAVFALEASRLARNGHEWHRLLEVCGLFNTLIIDFDGIYEPKHPNDRLLLGMKGTVSELELSTFRQRSQEAIREKARRGEYFSILPVGYSRREDGILVKDANQRVQESIQLVFQKFRELASARQVYFWFHRERIELPRQLSERGRPVAFRLPTPATILNFLSNPCYAGAYAFGRTKRGVKFENGRKRVFMRRTSMENWMVLIKQHHEEYISWEEYTRNRQLLMHNANMKGAMVQGSIKRGSALLAGILRCGKCGSKLQVAYQGKQRMIARYECRTPYDQSDSRSCQAFGGFSVEQAIARACLESVAPLGFEAALRAEQQFAKHTNEIQRQRELELDQARYEAQRCERQYNAVEPENRLVAVTLEQRWNAALLHVQQLENEIHKQFSPPAALTATERKRLAELAEDLPALWNHPATSNELKKRIVRTLIKEIIVYQEETKIRLMIHWHGGHHSTTESRRYKTGQNRWNTDTETPELLRQLARQMSDREIAALFNRLGRTTPKGNSWTGQALANYRNKHAIAVYRRGERQARAEMTVKDVASHFDVNQMMVLRAIARKVFPARQVCRGAPWIIRAEHIATISKDQLYASYRLGNPQTQDPNQLTFEL